MRSCILLIVFVVAGCSTSVDRAALSLRITQNGSASIEQSRYGSGFGVGVVKTAVLIFGIDGIFPSEPGAHGVFRLAGGSHDIRISAQFTRMAWHTYIDNGEGIVRFDAEPGKRYRVEGKELNSLSGEVWIVEVESGREVSGRMHIALNPNRMDEGIPMLIPIPIRR
jgi:hypothetical protein